MSVEKPSDEDIRLGQLIQISRIRMGMSQKDVAQKIGISFQQMQKYECGDNRVSASRLIQIARAFDMSLSQILGEAEKPYPWDKKISHLIKRMYTLPESRRELIYSIVNELTSYANPNVSRNKHG